MKKKKISLLRGDLNHHLPLVLNPEHLPMKKRRKEEILKKKRPIKEKLIEKIKKNNVRNNNNYSMPNNHILLSKENKNDFMLEKE